MKSVRRMYSNFCNGSSRVRSGGSVALGVTLVAAVVVLVCQQVRAFVEKQLRRRCVPNVTIHTVG